MPFYFSDPTPPNNFHPYFGGAPNVQQISTADQAFIIAKEMRKAERRAKRELLSSQEADKKNKKPDDAPKKWYQKLSSFEIIFGMLCATPFIMLAMANVQILIFQHLKEVLNATFK